MKDTDCKIEELPDAMKERYKWKDYVKIAEHARPSK